MFKRLLLQSLLSCVPLINRALCICRYVVSFVTKDKRVQTPNRKRTTHGYRPRISKSRPLQDSTRLRYPYGRRPGYTPRGSLDGLSGSERWSGPWSLRHFVTSQLRSFVTCSGLGFLGFGGHAGSVLARTADGSEVASACMMDASGRFSLELAF